MGLDRSVSFLLVATWIFILCNGNPVLLFANHQDIQLVEVGTQQQTLNSSVIIPNLKDAIAVDFIYDEGIIFWSDIALEVIKRVSLNDTKRHQVVAEGLKSADGLAIDWIGRKLYWTDSEFNRIEVSNWNGDFRKNLFWLNLDQPRAIALDPENGYMYWTDWGETPKIEKAAMDGNQDTRSVLIDKNIDWPNGLTIDYDDSKLYWSDAKLSHIHSCDFDGGNRRVVVDGKLAHPFALTLYGDMLFWTDWKDKSIYGCNKRTGTEMFVVMDEIYSPQDIHAFMKSRQPKNLSNIGGQNMCGENNGGCSHLCLLSPIEPYFTCACPTGIRLRSDNATCVEMAETMLFLARRSDIRQISLDTPDHTDLVLPLKGLEHAIALDYDSSTGFIYWTDNEARAIQRAQLDGSEQEVLVDLVKYSVPEGLAIDWIAKNLYWADAHTNRIEVCHLNSSSRKVIISDKLDEPRAICLDPAAGYMYWSDWSPKKPVIERAYLDGSQRQVIVKDNLRWPNGLAIDLVDRKLYWGDGDTDRIEVCDLDGFHRKVLIADKLQHIFGFTLLGDYIYWTDWQTRSIERINKYTGGNRTYIIDQLPDVMGLKAVDINRYAGTNTCGLNNGNCSHLCLYRPPPKTRVCACPMGLELQADGRTCIVPEAYLIFSSGSDIRRISLEKTSQNNQLIPIQGVEKAMAIDFDLNDNSIYWTDVDLKHISRAFMNGSNLQTIIQFGLSEPEGLAVDWVAHNIYWADTGKKRIEVARLDGSSRKVLVWRDLKEPRAIALDPPQGYMYWTVWGDDPCLERANLDGTNRKVVISGIGHVQDLTIDYVDRRLYWTDIKDHSIKSADMNGNDMRTVVESKVQSPMGLSQYEDFVYWTDIQRKTIERANKTDGSNRTVMLANVGPVMDILVIHTSRQAGGNACLKNNGDCSHLCIAHPLDEAKNQTPTHHCACPTHYTLNKDGHTCTAPKQYLLLSTRNSTIRLVIDSDSVDNPEVVLPINNMKNIKALAYDPVGEFIYWLEKKRQKTIIKRAHDNGTWASVVINNPDSAFQPYDIAIDPYARTLYWTCSVNNVINVTRIGVVNRPIGVIMTSPKRFKPRSIALYPEKGIMFYTNMLSSPRIERAMMDGSAPTVILKNVQEHPQSLTIDKRENKLYWADPELNRIEMSNFSGGDRIVLVDGNLGKPKGLAVYGKFLYWLNKESSFVERIHKKSRTKRLWVRGRISGLSDLISVEHSVSAMWHPCFNNNNGCSHICFITEGNKTHCSCPVGLVLKSDKQTCAEPPTCSSDQFTCANGQCIPLLWRCDFYSECEDRSDEENCDECKPSEFKCTNGKCIDKDRECDQRKHCPDGSDELNCCVGENCSVAGSIGQTVIPASKSHGEGRSKTSKEYTIAIVVVIVFLLMVVILILVCRHKSHSNANNGPVYEDIIMVKKPLNAPLGSGGGGDDSFSSPQNTMTRGKSVVSGMSDGSGMCPPYYDRNHVTGASSSSSAVTHYPMETLNPPPSPVTDRSLYKAPSGNVYVSLNSLSTFQRPTTGGTTSGRRRNHHHRRHHHHHHHHHHNIPPPPTTPCSTDVCEDSEPYHLVAPVHSSTPATNKHSGGRSKSRSARSNAKKKHRGVQDDALVRLNYDSDPYPPPPTPRSHYFFDDMSCPPSPSTERSYFNPYPPPPSPVAASDC